MKCECGGNLRVTHTLTAGLGSQAREHKCDKCNCRRTSVSFIVKDREKEGGAAEMVRKLKLGLVTYETKDG